MDVKEFLRKNEPSIRLRVTNLSIIISHLYSVDLISAEDKESITNAYVNTTQAQKWDKISEILIRKSCFLTMDKLTEMFQISENYHIIYEFGLNTAQSSGQSSSRSIIMEEKPEPDSRFRDIIRQNYEFLTYKLVNHDEVAKSMSNKKIILPDKRNKIIGFITNLDKADEILTCMLSGTNVHDYQNFLEILRDTGNKASLDVLEKAGHVKIPEKLLKFEREEREALKGDFKVQNHHCVNIALKLSEVPGLSHNWDLFCEEILTPRAIANLENEINFETKIMRTIQAWINRMGRNASYNLLIEKIKTIHNRAGGKTNRIKIS